MKTKKRTALLVLAAVLFVGASAPAVALTICDVPTTSPDIWFAKKMARCS